VKGYRKPEWQKTRERNEALDTRIYERAAASHFGMDRFQEQHWAALEKQMAITAKPAPPQPQVASPTPPHARPDFNRNQRAVDPFHRLDYKPRWLGDRKRWFDR
jgi:phage terminase large subunit GpA-like protein